MPKTTRYGHAALSLALVVSMTLTGCQNQAQNQAAEQNTPQKKQQTLKQAGTAGKENEAKKLTAKKGKGNGDDVKRIGMLEVNDKEARIPTRLVQGRILVPLGELLLVMGYQSRISDDNKEILIGGIDPLYRLTINSNKAEREGEPITLSESPVIVDEKVYLPESTLIDLFQRDIRYLNDGKELTLSAINDDNITLDKIEEGDAPDGPSFFGDDPNDPFKGPLIVGSDNKPLGATNGITAKATGLPNIDINALIQTAMKYRGVPYLFGASSYTKSRRFDCSSFTQYVFAKYGIRLNRVSRNQATQGIFVSRANLRKGDLVFFSVPGRFTSDNIVGHVGIYIGNGNMIHTYSTASGGVHVSSINSGSWPKKYLRARRVAY